MRSVWLALVVTACGSTPSTPDGNTTPPHDAPPLPPPQLDSHGCPIDYAPVSLSIADADAMFMPSGVVLVAGQYLKLTTSSQHDMHFANDPIAGTGGSPPADLGFSLVRCDHLVTGHVRFLVTCTVHGEMASITVGGGGA